MQKRKNVWLGVLWCLTGTAVSVGAAWLISFVPWADSKAFRLGAVWTALICSVLEMILLFLKPPLRETPWMKTAVRLERAVYWLSWVCYGATLL